MKKKLFLSLAFCTLGAMAVQAGSETILFNSTDTKTAPYRIPAITTMSNGEIIAISDYRPGGKDVGNSVEVDIYARISSDNGVSWTGTDTPHDDTSDYIKIADGTASLAFGDAAVAAHPTTGEVLVISVGGVGTAFTDAGSSTSDYYCYRHYSSDYGRTWNRHDNITTQFKGNDSKLKNKSVYAMFFASGRLLVSKYTSGRIYGALLTKESGGTYNYVFYTDDFGLTWVMLGSDYAISGADEAKVEELPNGDIVISSRTTGGRIFNVYSMSNAKWGTQQTYTFASNCKATNGELMLYKGVYKVDETTGDTYDVLLQSLPVGSSRKQVSVFYKEVANQAYTTSDIASGWAKGIEVCSENSAYSAMTIQSDSKIGFLYEKDYYSSNFNDNYKSGYAKGGTANIVYIPYTIEELTGGIYTTTAPVVTPVDPTLSLSAAATTLTVDATTQLTATTNSDGAVSYTSSDESVATVSSNGEVTAKAVGEATITANVAATAKYNAASATCKITVTAAVVTPVDPTLSLSAANSTLTVGETTALTLTTNSDGAVSYASSDESVATVSADGVVEAVGAGTATITANVGATEQYNATSATATITVNRATPTFSLPATTATLKVGETTTLTATTNSDGAVSYESSNTAVATVTANGEVTAVATGTATITANVAATNKYNAASATCSITVEASAETKTYTPKLLKGKIGTTTFYLVTFSASEAVKILTSGVKAYYVKATGDDAVKLTRLSGTVIPAEMGVILLGTGSGAIELTTTTETGTAVEGNLLVGTVDEVNPVLQSTDYILAVKGSGELKDKFAFCQIPETEDGYTVEDYANRAYLSLSTTFATRSITLSFDDEEGGTTAIDEVETTVETPAEYYTLQGMKVDADKLTPGIYIMKQHGKTRKVVF